MCRRSHDKAVVSCAAGSVSQTRQRLIRRLHLRLRSKFPGAEIARPRVTNQKQQQVLRLDRASFCAISLKMTPWKKLARDLAGKSSNSGSYQTSKEFPGSPARRRW